MVVRLTRHTTKRDNSSDSEAPFLDIDFKVVNRKFSYEKNDERNSFPFSIVTMPYLCSNMLYKIFDASLGAEVLRIARATT